MPRERQLPLDHGDFALAYAYALRAIDTGDVYDESGGAEAGCAYLRELRNCKRLPRGGGEFKKRLVKALELNLERRRRSAFTHRVWRPRSHSLPIAICNRRRSRQIICRRG
jgi:hypothetical protein